MNFFTSMAVGWGIKLAAKEIDKLYTKLHKKYAPAIIRSITKIDDWLEEKTGMDLFQDSTQKAFDEFVNKARHIVESEIVDPKKLRAILNAAIRSKGDNALEKVLEGLAFDSLEKFKEIAPDSLKKLLSSAKLQAAKEEFLKLWHSYFPDKKVSDDKIHAGISAMVAVKNKNHKKLKEILAGKDFDEKMKYLLEEEPS